MQVAFVFFGKPMLCSFFLVYRQSYGAQFVCHKIQILYHHYIVILLLEFCKEKYIIHVIHFQCKLFKLLCVMLFLKTLQLF